MDHICARSAASAPPRHHGGVKTPRRFVNVELAREVHGDRVDRLAPFLFRVDELADRAVEAIASRPGPSGWAAFERALREGAAHAKDAPEAVRELVAFGERVPAWVEWPTCDRGGDMLMRAGLLGGLVLGARSLVLGYASPGGNKPLVMSGRLRDMAARRLNETARFVQAVSRRGGMRPHAEGWQITLKVRLIHAQVRRMILASGKWDEDAWGAPINQHDMAGTTLLFSLVLVDGLRTLGMTIPPEEAEAYMHLWRWAGWLIGVDPELLPTSELDAARLAELIAATQGPPDADARELTRVLLTSPLEVARTPAERRAAERRVRFGTAMCRELLGDELADGLGVARGRFRYELPILRRVVSGMEVAARNIPGARKRALAAGNRYWDRVVALGLQNASYDFPLPTGLAAA
ncbi:MAG: DUF2236 domain-containing protein [Myxococcales bacterium]|nr:DUF2236 domain-containing protein [Myxococcales bacterium]